MKKIFLLSTGIFTLSLVQAQNSSNAPKVDSALLNNLDDSASYAIGMSVANFYKAQGVKKINSKLVCQAIDEVLAEQKAKLSDDEANQVMNAILNRAQMELVQPNIDEGEAFLAKNKLKPEVKISGSGLQYEVLREGTGPTPSPTDSVTCNYFGKLLNGFEFDNSYNRGQPAKFSLTRVITGWVEGLQLMNVGSKYRFWVPYEKGYGLHGNGSIPGGALLVFEIELLDIKKK